MKKHSLLAIIMVIALCLTMVMSGCQDDTKNNEPKEDLTLELAANNTLNALFSSDCTVGVLENMNEKKVVTVALDGQFENVLNLDIPNKSFYDELSITSQGQTIGANLYCNGTDLAVTAPDLLGSDMALGINLKTLLTDLKNSSLWDELEYSAVASVIDNWEQIEDLISSVTNASANEEAEKLAQEILNALEGVEETKTEGSVTVYDETIDAVNFTYVLDETDIKNVMDVVLSYSGDTFDNMLDTIANAGIVLPEGTEVDNIYADLQKEMDKVFEGVDMEWNVTVSVNPENRCIMRMDANLTCTAEGENVKGSMEWVLGKDPAKSDRFTMNLNLFADEEEEMKVKAVLFNTTEGSVDTTTLDLDAEMDGQTQDLTVSCTYNNDSHEYKLALNVVEEEYAVIGKLENTDNKLSLTIDELQSPEENMGLGLSLTIENDPDCEIPQVPSYTNVLTDMDLTGLLGMGSEEYTDVPASEEDWETSEDWEDLELDGDIIIE